MCFGFGLLGNIEDSEHRHEIITFATFTASNHGVPFLFKPRFDCFKPLSTFKMN